MFLILLMIILRILWEKKEINENNIIYVMVFTPELNDLWNWEKM